MFGPRSLERPFQPLPLLVVGIRKHEGMFALTLGRMSAIWAISSMVTATTQEAAAAAGTVAFARVAERCAETAVLANRAFGLHGIPEFIAERASSSSGTAGEDHDSGSSSQPDWVQRVSLTPGFLLKEKCCCMIAAAFGNDFLTRGEAASR